ncbi:MAG: hypothetical protein JXA64_03940 [Candidatus Fermentibacteraceae bacterium]|nr:hypothetical protein [Candidatus Fermentibacteraceae bacterium]MBN2608243.1 hypothetical protein [Candidatus Fermentibacteraceae bacterium]
MMMKTLPIVLVVLSGLLESAEYTLLESDTLEIPVSQYRAVRFEVAPEMSEEAGLSGSLLIDPDTASVEMILLHIDDYLRWSEEGGPVDTLAYLEISSGPFRMDLPGLGRYALVISNRGNYRPATVVMAVDLIYRGSGQGDPLPAAMKLALLLIVTGAAAFAVGSVMVKFRRKPRKNTD